MQQTLTIERSWAAAFAARVSDYALLTKFRLSFLVVFSAAIGFLYGSALAPDYGAMLLLALGGFLVTGASNTLNQILEKDVDRLMARTMNRPLAAGRMSVTEAVIAAGLMGVSGIALLAVQFNTLAGLLSALSLISYAFIYTPLKRITPASVFVGAFPGALPVLIGYVCATGGVTFEAMLLFGIQFLWQFPHFWAIAWVSFDDYKKGGFMLLPSASGKSKWSALQNVVYCTFLFIVAMMPYFMGWMGWRGALATLAVSVVFLMQAIALWKSCDDADARRLMFGSFLFLPVVQLALVMDKL